MKNLATIDRCQYSIETRTHGTRELTNWQHGLKENIQGIKILDCATIYDKYSHVPHPQQPTRTVQSIIYDSQFFVYINFFLIKDLKKDSQEIMLMRQVILVKTERVNDLEWILMGIHWFVLWLGTILVPSHYTNQLFHIIFCIPKPEWVHIHKSARWGRSTTKH